MKPLIKQTSAWLPIVLSLVMIGIFIFYFRRSPIVHETDEGIPAHLFQIWLVLEFFMIGFFALKWLTQKPKQALVVLAIQIILVFIVCFPVFYFKL